MAASLSCCLLLAAVAAVGACILLGVAHLDLAEMRTVRPAFNFDGIIAFFCGAMIAAGLVVLFPLWRFLAFEPDLAHRDLTVWIGTFAALLLGLHLPFAVSLSIDAWINATVLETPGQSLRNLWISGDSAFLLLLLLWPIPAIFGLWHYKRNFANQLRDLE